MAGETREMPGGSCMSHGALPSPSVDSGSGNGAHETVGVSSSESAIHQGGDGKV